MAGPLSVVRQHPSTPPDPLTVRGLTVSYGARAAVFSVDAVFPRGTMTAIVGPNGAGKSTFLKGVLGIEKPVAGEVRFFGQSLSDARRRVAYVPQRASVDWDFPARVIDVVRMGLYARKGLFRPFGASDTARARECLAMVGMQDFADRQIGQLSGGQQQRVFIARSLAEDADLYLLDEPMAGVDAATEAAIFALLKRLRDEGRTLVVVHHDLSSVTAMFDRVLVLNRRKIAEGPVAEAFGEDTLTLAYGGRLTGIRG
ncbi:MAG: metal ABC transporter ATP-binding protein [Rubricella sp.]